MDLHQSGLMFPVLYSERLCDICGLLNPGILGAPECLHRENLGTTILVGKWVEALYMRPK